MRITHEGRTFVLPEEQWAYRPEIETYFDRYFNAIDEDVAELDFTQPRLTSLHDFPFPIWLPSITEPVADLQHYLDHAQLQKGDTAIDAGGYVGITAMLLARQVGPAGTVITIEADPVNADCLARNLDSFRRHYGHTPILIDAALWREAGTVSFSGEAAMGSAIKKYIGDRGTSKEVKAVTLGMIGQTVSTVNYLKLDVEGAETEVLRDQGFFDRHRPRVSVEVHRGNRDEIEQLLNGYGYTVEERTQESSLYPMLEATPEG